MLAALGLEHGHHLSVEEVEPLPPGPHDVVVRVGASGVCHTDVAVLGGLLPIPLPVVLGHEGAGVVVETGSDVTSVAVGDRVVGSVGAVCGTCWFCIRQMTHLCAESQALTAASRLQRADGTEVGSFVGLGSFAELMIVHEASVVRVQTELPDEQLALIGCAITTGLGAVFNTAQVVPGSSVVVIGCGGVGQAVVQGARIAGAARIIAVDPGEAKRAAAVGFGATDVLDPTAVDTLDEVGRLTGGRGADYSFEVVGSPTTIRQAWDLARRGGTVAVLGIYDDLVPVSAYDLSLAELRLVGSNCYSHVRGEPDFAAALALLAGGDSQVGAVVTHQFELERVQEAFLTAADKRTGSIKVVVRP